MEEREIGNGTWVLLAILLFCFAPIVIGDEAQEKPADVVEVNGEVKFNCIPVKIHPGMVVCTFQIDITSIGKALEVIPKVMNEANHNEKSW